MFPKTKSKKFFKVNLTGNALEFLELCERASSFPFDHSTPHQLVLGGNRLTCMKPFEKLFLFLQDRLRELSLKDNFLSQFPMDILVLKNLTALSLNNNRLHYIPEGTLSQLTGLLWLNLGNNELTSLPVDIISCSKLKGLHLSANKFTEFPRPVYFLNELEMLSVGLNKINHISDELGKLQKLHSLDLSCNRFRQVPAVMVYNPPLNLSHLYFGGNPLRTIHPSFLSIGYKRLAHFELFTSDIEHLSPEFFKHLSKCQELVHLNLSKNKLTSLPLEIGLLTQLEWLMINNNPLKELPHTMSKLTNLIRLYMVNTQIETLPPYMFSRMFKLETLDIRKNKLKYLPFSVLALTNSMRWDFLCATFRHILHPCCATSDIVCDRETRRLEIIGLVENDMRYLDGIIYSDDKVKEAFLVSIRTLKSRWTASSTAIDMMTNAFSRDRICAPDGSPVSEKLNNIYTLKELCIRSLLNHKQKKNNNNSYVDCQDEFLQEVLSSNHVSSLLQRRVVDKARFCDFCHSWYTESRFQLGYISPTIPVRIDVCSAECAFKILHKLFQHRPRENIALDGSRQQGVPEPHNPGVISRGVSRSGDFFRSSMSRLAALSRRVLRGNSFADTEPQNDGPNPHEAITVRYDIVNGEFVASYSYDTAIVLFGRLPVSSVWTAFAVRLATF